MRATRLARSGSRATSSHATPAASRWSRSTTAAAVSRPGGLVVSTRISLWHRSRTSARASSAISTGRILTPAPHAGGHRLVRLAGGRGDREHEAAVGDVAAVHLDDAGLAEHRGDRGLRVAAVVHPGRRVDPATAVVRAQHLRTAEPVARVPVAVVPRARLGVGEHRPDLAVRPVGGGRPVAEQQQRLAGPRVPQAAAQRFAARSPRRARPESRTRRGRWPARCPAPRPAGRVIAKAVVVVMPPWSATGPRRAGGHRTSRWTRLSGLASRTCPVTTPSAASSASGRTRTTRPGCAPG